MKVFIAFAFVVQIGLCAGTSSMSDHCAPRDCTKEWIPVCAQHPDTGAETTFANNCTRLFLGCRYIYLRNGKCTEDWTMFEQLKQVGESFQPKA